MEEKRDVDCPVIKINLQNRHRTSFLAHQVVGCLGAEKQWSLPRGGFFFFFYLDLERTFDTVTQDILISKPEKKTVYHKLLVLRLKKRLETCIKFGTFAQIAEKYWQWKYRLTWKMQVIPQCKRLCTKLILCTASLCRVAALQQHFN